MNARGGANWIHHSRGVTFRQAHHHERDDLKEEELTRDGFVGPSALLYRRNDPTSLRGDPGFSETFLQASTLLADDRAAPSSTIPVVSNDLATVSLHRIDVDMAHSRRNIGADEVYFVHEGAGIFVTEFGPIPYERGDYVVVPRAITYRITTSAPTTFWLIESVGALTPPPPGPWGRHAPLDPNVLFIPTPEPDGDDSPHEVLVRRGTESGFVRLSHSPYDVEGWRGDYFPYKVNVRDWNAVMSASLHLPPSAHVFLATASSDLVLVHIAPRPMERSEAAEKLPYYHRNLDYDELNFVHDGTMGVLPLEAGTIIHTPQGLNHGPPEKLRQRQRAAYRPDDRWTLSMVMVESRLPFRVNPELSGAGAAR